MDNYFSKFHYISFTCHFYHIFILFLHKKMNRLLKFKIKTLGTLLILPKNKITFLSFTCFFFCAKNESSFKIKNRNRTIRCLAYFALQHHYIIRHYSHSPPRMIMSLTRPVMRMYPRESMMPRSPVCNQSLVSMVARVASASPWYPSILQ